MYARMLASIESAMAQKRAKDMKNAWPGSIWRTLKLTRGWPTDQVQSRSGLCYIRFLLFSFLRLFVALAFTGSSPLDPVQTPKSSNDSHRGIGRSFASHATGFRWFDAMSSQKLESKQICAWPPRVSLWICELELFDQLRSFFKHLPKYSSLPEFQLIAKETSSSFHCRRCGLTASVINPICPSLGNAWTCSEAQQQQQHEFASSVPRARRASAPSRVFLKVDLSPWNFTFLTGDHENIGSNRLEAPLEQGELNETASVIDPLPIVSSQSPYMPVDLHRDHIDNIDDIDINDYSQQREVPESLGDVATATHSVCGKKLLQKRKSNPSLSFDKSSTSPLSFGQSTTKPVGYKLEGQRDSAMGLKILRRTFNVGLTDKKPSFHHDDVHEHAKNVSQSHDNNELTPTPINSAHPHSPKHQHFRPLRRKNHLHIMPCAPDPDISEPIAISLTLHHSSPPTSTRIGKKSSQRLRRHSHSRAHSHHQSISSDSGDPVTPVTPTRSPPTSIPPPPNTSSPVRLGHPSRPYYTAIRKNIFPPSPPRSRPQSTEPPMTSTAIMTNASRHLSMPAMPFASSTGVNDDDDFEVHSGPTNSARLSLSSILHRQSYDNRTQTHTRNAQSLSRAANRIIGHRSNGFGCSMSGEAELRMALAASSPSSVATTTSGRRPTTEDEFRFSETAVPSQNLYNNKKNIQNSSTNTGTDYLHTRRFMSRVKKLRKGLKEMLMN